MIAEIVVFNDTRSTDQLFSYRVPATLTDRIAAGMRVQIPFGRGDRPCIGIVIRTIEQEDPRATKDIVEILDETPLLPPEMMDLAFWLRDTTHCNLYRAFRTVSPPGDVKTIEFVYAQADAPQERHPFAYWEEQWGGDAHRRMREALVEGSMLASVTIQGGVAPRTQVLVSLKETDAEAVFPEHHMRKTAVLDLLRRTGEMPRPALLKETGATTATLRSLEKDGWIEQREAVMERVVLDAQAIRATAPPDLTESQKNAIEALASKPGTFLLHGVTGSGKTEVYLQLVARTLQEGRQAVILVPEISLTPQTISRFTSRFGTDIAVLHSKLSVAERFEQWKKIRNGEVSMVVGARSAVFAPFSRLGLIVVDEEQEDSYRSDQQPRYDAISVAKKRAAYHGATLVLGSATPRIATYRAAEQREIERIALPKRVHGRPLPPIRIVDMKEELRKGNTSMFSLSLREQVAQTLARGEQTILFLNKRGHSSFVFCRKCGFVKRCTDCDVSMTYHEHKDILLCHYCGLAEKPPRLCPECGSNAIGHFGAGTEQVETYARQLYPEARIVRMDADTTTHKNAHADFDKKMRSGQIDILIGTQMIAKGLDFAGVSLVGILLADISLNLPDYRANERTFQLITQVAGRAGRGTTPGEVILQTYHPTHFAIETARTHDYRTFYEKEIVLREHFRYPPFVTAVNIVSSARDPRAALAAIQNIHGQLLRFQRARDLSWLQTIGPSQHPIHRLRGRYRYQLMLKCDRHKEETHAIIDWLLDGTEKARRADDVRIQFLIDEE